MKITSPAFFNNQPIPTKYTCQGENINPPLVFDIEKDKNATSYVLIIDDPDTPGGTYTHWIIWNIDGNCTNVYENSIPRKGVEGTNSYGSKGYIGPCPTFGMHRYYFRLYALNTKLQLPEGSSRNDLENAMKGHIISNAKYIGLYSRLIYF